MSDRILPRELLGIWVQPQDLNSLLLAYWKETGKVIDLGQIVIVEKVDVLGEHRIYVWPDSDTYLEEDYDKCFLDIIGSKLP